MSDLVGNPEDRFSQNEAHMKGNKCTCKIISEIIFYSSSFIKIAYALSTIVMLTAASEHHSKQEEQLKYL